MPKSQKPQPIAAEIKAAFRLWMEGTPFVVLKKKVGRPLMSAFTMLADATTWKQAKTRRDKAVQTARKEHVA